MDVRRVGPAEAAIGVEAIRVLKAPNGYPFPSVDYVSWFVSRPQNVFLVAIKDGEAIGYVVAYFLDRNDSDQKMMLLYEIGVGEPHRRRGVGKALTVSLKAICREEKCDEDVGCDQPFQISEQHGCTRVPVE